MPQFQSLESRKTESPDSRKKSKRRGGKDAVSEASTSPSPLKETPSPAQQIQVSVMDLLLLGCYTRFSGSLIKWNTQWAKITISPIQTPIHPTPIPSTGCSNWPIIGVHFSKLIWQQIFPCQYIISYIYLCNLMLDA